MNYLLTIRVRFEANDDPDARQITEGLLEETNFHTLSHVGSAKLQRLPPGREPRPVNLNQELGKKKDNDAEKL